MLLELFFATPSVSASVGNSQNHDEGGSLLDDFDIEPSLGKSSRSSKSSRTLVSTRSSNRSSKSKKSYARDDESDNDLGFDSS
jgi:hypothetical protein